MIPSNLRTEIESLLTAAQKLSQQLHNQATTEADREAASDLSESLQDGLAALADYRDTPTGPAKETHQG